MNQSPKAGAGAPERRKRITLERVYQTDVQDVWDLWTTKDGIESGALATWNQGPEFGPKWYPILLVITLPWVGQAACSPARAVRRR